MIAQQVRRISVIDPISPAIDRIKIILFKPFDLGRWFIIGFCAWLAYLGNGAGGAGGGPNFNIPRKHHRHDLQIGQAVSEAKQYLLDNLPWIIPAAIIAAVVIIGIWLVITWLSSRGRFMFLHCVANNKAQVKAPWREYRKQANSLFLFRIVLWVIGLVAVGLPVAGLVIFIIITLAKTGFHVASVLGFVIIGLVIAALSVVLFLAKKFTMDFVVPIMFLQRTSCVAGWREFMTILSANKLRFALYLLFQIVIVIAIGAIISLGFCIGCCLCCVSLLLLIPYIGTVIILPLLVFKRAYSLYYLRQFGSEFDVFARENKMVLSP